jgi:hypothetical protein
MHPLMIEELAAERSRALHEQARRARLGALVGGSARGRIARRLGLWFVSTGMRMAGRPGDRVIVEFAGGGPSGRRAIRIDRSGGSRRIRG